MFERALRYSNRCLEVGLYGSLAIGGSLNRVLSDQPSGYQASSTGDPLEASSHPGLVESMESWGVKTGCPTRLWSVTVGSASSHVVWGRYIGTAAV